MSTIELKTVGEILNKQFIIPTYQRGYRWTEKQIKDLLSDLCEFHHIEKSINDFYCLQPMVVKKDNNNDAAFIVIDGQQRLTTLKMVVAFLSGNKDEDCLLSGIKYSDNTREKKFSEIDKIFKGNARETIKNFSYKDYGVEKSDLLLNTIKERVKFIWYEVDENANEYEIFSRLNIGKIPLTNAELLKACFLCDGNFRDGDELTQIQMAAEWDRIELELQDESLWYFFKQTPNTEGTYIDAIFKIMHPNNTFAEFYKELRGKDANTKNMWRKVYNLFLQLKEWHDDEKIGGLAWFAIKNNLINLENENYKSIDFREKIKNWLKDKRLACESNGKIEIKLDEVGYGDDNTRKIIELANVCYCADKRILFPYEKTRDLDIEHISAQDDDLEKFNNAFFESLYAPLDFVNKVFEGHNLTNNDIKTNIETLKQRIEEEKQNKHKFWELYDDIKKFPFLSQFVGSLDEKEKNNIGNLVLLPKGINRSYKNAIFTKKRYDIAKACGEIMPLTLRAFFREYYDEQESAKNIEFALYWTEKDVENLKNYEKRLIEKILN